MTYRETYGVHACLAGKAEQNAFKEVIEKNLAFSILLAASGITGYLHHETDAFNGRLAFRDKVAGLDIVPVAVLEIINEPVDWQRIDEFIELAVQQKLIRKNRNGFWLLTFRGSALLRCGGDVHRVFRSEVAFTKWDILSRERPI